MPIMMPIDLFYTLGGATIAALATVLTTAQKSKVDKARVEAEKAASESKVSAEQAMSVPEAYARLVEQLTQRVAVQSKRIDEQDGRLNDLRADLTDVQRRENLHDDWERALYAHIINRKAPPPPTPPFGLKIPWATRGGTRPPDDTNTTH